MSVVPAGTEDRRSVPRAPGPVRRVLVSYESSACGRAALSHALGIARQARAPLTIVSVATKEPVNVGCARCRQSAALWNREMRSLADENLVEAGGLVGPSPAVDYAVAAGPPLQALAEAADARGADVVVVPWEPSGRLRRLLSSTLAEGLRRVGRWEVVVAPRAPSERRSHSSAEQAPPAGTGGVTSH